MEQTPSIRQIGINQAYEQLLIKQKNAPNVMSTPFLIFTTPSIHQKGMITPVHVVFCFLDESSFYTASGNF